MLTSDIQHKFIEDESKSEGDNNGDRSQISILNQTDLRTIITSLAEKRRNEALALNQIPEILLKRFTGSDATSQEKRASDCPLWNGYIATTKYKKIQVHVFPKALPFTVDILLHCNNDFGVYYDHFYLESDLLKIQKDIWSNFMFSVYHSNGYWKVRVLGNGLTKSIVSEFTYSRWVYDHFHIEIQSADVNWYIGARNNKCDKLTTNANSPPATSPRPTSTPSTVRDITAIDSTTQAILAFSEPMNDEGK